MRFILVQSSRRDLTSEEVDTLLSLKDGFNDVLSFLSGDLDSMDVGEASRVFRRFKSDHWMRYSDLSLMAERVSHYHPEIASLILAIRSIMVSLCGESVAGDFLSNFKEFVNRIHLYHSVTSNRGERIRSLLRMREAIQEYIKIAIDDIQRLLGDHVELEPDLLDLEGLDL